MGLLSLGRRLDDRVMGRRSWMSQPVPNWQLQLGMPWAVIFGGGLLLRLLLHPWLGRPALELWIYAGLALPGLLLLALGMRAARRQRSH